MSELDLNQLRLILLHIEQPDKNGKTIKYSATKEFKKLISQNNQLKITQNHLFLCKADSYFVIIFREINNQMITICNDIITNQKERLHSRLYALKFITACLLEGNIFFIESFQDHQLMDFFTDVAQFSTFGFDEKTFGTMYLNSENPTQVEQQNSQNFVRMLLECCVILSQIYPVRQNKQRSVSKFKQLIDTLRQGECYIPTDRKIQTQDIGAIQNNLIEQNYIGVSQNRQSQGDLNQNLSTMNKASTTQQGLQGSRTQINQSQTNKGTPQPSLTESMATKIKGLNANDYNQYYKENLKLLEQIRLSCIQNLDYDQYLDQFIKKLSDIKSIFDNCNLRDDEIKNKAEMISIVDQEVLDTLLQYKRTNNAEHLINYFLDQYEQTLTQFLGETIPNNQAPQGQVQGQSQRKIEEQKMREQEIERQRYEQEQRELEELQNQRHQQMLEMKEKERQRLEEEEVKQKQQKLLQDQQEQEKQLQLKKQKEQEMQRQLEQEKQQQLLKKQQEEEKQRQIEKQKELERQKEIEKQKEQERQQKLLLKQKEEEIERQKQLQKQQEQQNQMKQHQNNQIQEQQMQSQIKNSHMHYFNENVNDEDGDDGIYKGSSIQASNNSGFKNNNDFNIYQSRHNKMPSVIEEEGEDFERSNKNLSQIKQDINQSSNNKRYHSQINQSSLKGSFEMKNSKFQAALNQMADQERSKLRESRLSVRSNYELEKSSSMSRFDPNKSKPVISKGVSREEHKAAINKEKEEKFQLEKVLFNKDAEINSQKDAMKLMSKEMIELKTVKDHLEKDILKYQQKIQLYESGNAKEGEKFIEKINLLENEISNLKEEINHSDDKYKTLLEQKQDLEGQIMNIQNELNEFKQKNEKLEKDLDSEKMKQSKLEERVTDRLSKTQSQLEKEISLVTVEKNDLEIKLKKLNEDHLKLIQQHSHLADEHQHVKSDFANYRQQVDLIQSGIEKQQSKGQKQLEEQEAIIQDLKKQSQKLGEENKKLFDQNKLLQKELELKEQEIDTMNDKLLSMENDRQNTQEMKSEIKTTNDNHKYVEMRNKWQEEKNLHLENLNKFKKDTKQLQDLNDQLQVQLTEAQRQVNELQNQLVQQNNTHSQEMAKLLQEKQNQQNNKQQQDQSEYEEIINQIQRELLQKNKLIEEITLDSEKQIREEKSKVAALSVRIQQLEQAHQEIIPQKNSDEETQKYKKQLDEQQEDLKKQIKLNQEQNELLFNLHKELAQEKKNLDELKLKYNLLNEQINHAGAQIAKQESEHQSLNQKYKELEEKYKKLKEVEEKNHSLTQQVKDLQEKLDQSKQPDKQLLDQIEELQQINTQLHVRIDLLMLQANKPENQQDQFMNAAEQEVGAQQMAQTQPKKFTAQKPQEIIIEQDVDNMATNSMLSDAKRINECLDDKNGMENRQQSAFKYESAQRQNQHQQQNQYKLSEMGKRGNQYVSPQQRDIQNRPLSYDKFNSSNQNTIQNKISPVFFEAQDNFQTIPVNFAQDMRQIDPESAALIFPFQNPVQYYENKAPKIIKGKLIRNDYNLFSYLPNNPQMMYRFKRGCLKENFPLFQNEDIQIGLISRLMVNDRADILEIVLYFTNRIEEVISDLQVYYNPGKTNTLELDPQELDTEILPGVQKSQRLLIGINEIPFEIIQLDFSYRFKYSNKRYTLAIPNTINKFFEPRMMDVANFKYLWGNSKDQIYRSEEIYLEEKVAKSSYDFLNYFKNFMEINEAKQQDYLLGLNETKVGGCFQLRASNTRFLMKVSIGPNGQAIFQVSLIDQPIDELQNCVLEYIIQTFSLIFRSDQ